MPRSTIFHIRSSISHHSFRAANPGGELWFEAHGPDFCLQISKADEHDQIIRDFE